MLVVPEKFSNRYMSCTIPLRKRHVRVINTQQFPTLDADWTQFKMSCGGSSPSYYDEASPTNKLPSSPTDKLPSTGRRVYSPAKRSARDFVDLLSDDDEEDSHSEDSMPQVKRQRVLEGKSVVEEPSAFLLGAWSPRNVSLPRCRHSTDQRSHSQTALRDCKLGDQWTATCLWEMRANCLWEMPHHSRREKSHHTTS